MRCKVRLSSALAIGAMFAGCAAMRADTVFSSFGPGQSYQTNSWVNVGNGGIGNQVVAFPFVPTATATLSSVDVALAQSGLASPLVVSILSNNNGVPGSVLDALSQVGSFTAPSLVSFTCGTASCATLQAGLTYWLVAQQTSASALSLLFLSSTTTGAWYYSEAGSAAGPWTLATLSSSIGAFDVNGTTNQSPVPEPSSLVLLGSGMVAVLAKARGRLARQG